MSILAEKWFWKHEALRIVPYTLLYSTSICFCVFLENYPGRLDWTERKSALEGLALRVTKRCTYIYIYFVNNLLFGPLQEKKRNKGRRRASLAL